MINFREFNKCLHPMLFYCDRTAYHNNMGGTKSQETLNIENVYRQEHSLLNYKRH